MDKVSEWIVVGVLVVVLGTPVWFSVYLSHLLGGVL